MDYNFDIYDIYTSIDSLPPEIASLTCRSITDDSISSNEDILSCTYVSYVDSIPTNKVDTPFELLYTIYQTIYLNLKNTDIIRSIISEGDKSSPLNLAANYEPTCPQTITEIDSYKGSVDDIFEKVGEFLTLLINRKIVEPNKAIAANTTSTVGEAIRAALYELVNCIENNNANAHLQFIGNSTKYIAVEKNASIVKIDITTIMKPGIILTELDSFIEYLSTLYMFQVNVVIMKDKVRSEIKGTFHRPTDSACGYAPKGYKFLLAVQQQNVTSSNASDLYQNAKKVLYANRKISFDGIAKFSCFPASSQKMLVENGINTNGNYDSTIDIKTTENFDKEHIKQKYRDVANLEIGKIASRNDILHAIYDIFYYWMNNVNIVSINVNICHSNCHSNYYEIKKYRNNDAKKLVLADTIQSNQNFGTY